MPTDFTLENLGISVPGLSTQIGTITFMYIPDQIGEWCCMFTFAGQTITSPGGVTVPPYASNSVYYQPSTSNTFTSTVQKDRVDTGLLTGWPYSRLPTQYWTRPVSINNRVALDFWGLVAFKL